MAVSPTIDLSTIRSQFPALDSGFAYLENAGGSQVPECVANAMRDYMLSTYVQLGAGYPASDIATQTVDRAHQFINRFMNGEGTGKTILGATTTQLCHMLADCYARIMSPGDEIVVCETAHEANAGPWVKLAERGFDVRIWKIDPSTLECTLDSLRAILSDRTRIVAFPHVSNLLGGIVDVKAITALCHEYGARVVADGVAYAPHRAIDVADWDVDWYVYSTYKVFGPHMAALYGKQDAIDELEGPNHFFIPRGDIYKFELGGVSHEGCAGLLALGEYFNFLTGRSGEVGYDTVRTAFEAITSLEVPLQKRLMNYLLSKPRVRIIGPLDTNASRVCTISFVHGALPAPQIAAHVNRHGIGIRYGHMYAYRLCEALGINTDTGVVRVSPVHYNTPQEIEKLIAVFEDIL